ncbi:MAG: tRNA nucleotidyltransferase, partial [Flavobacteriaceae bacterium]|nr:tRNA nucleotidyltransferase [Flavobacteriaceae bacterium]
MSMQTYVIGGYVRDFLLQRKEGAKDIDIVAVGDGIALAKKVASELPGR